MGNPLLNMMGGGMPQFGALGNLQQIQAQIAQLKQTIQDPRAFVQSGRFSQEQINQAIAQARQMGVQL